MPKGRRSSVLSGTAGYGLVFPSERSCKRGSPTKSSRNGILFICFLVESVFFVLISKVKVSFFILSDKRFDKNLPNN